MINNISFKSKFRPVTEKEFTKLTSKINKENFVNYPWTLKESICANNAATTGVIDCSVLGITNGLKVLLMHLSATNELNHNLDEIKKIICENIADGNRPLQAVLLGSKDFSVRSVRLNRNLEYLMRKLNIPCTIMRNCNDEFDVTYSAESDEWCIKSLPTEVMLYNSKSPNSEKILKKAFEEVKISQFDEFG